MKKSRRKVNPFNPDAATPARLAGRDEELKDITQAVSAIANAPEQRIDSWNGLSHPPIQLHGPPGSGKTALLEAARRTAEEHSIHVVSVTSMPDLAIDGELVSGMLAGAGMAALPWKGLAKHAQRNKRRKTEEARDVYCPSLNEITETCLQRPVALLLDHVTDYDIESLRTFLLHYDWRFIGGSPLALLLAGTPQMLHTLLDTKVGLMYRCRRFSIGTLAPAAAREALRNPFEEHGMRVQEDALKLMTEMADDYPQFIQIVGHEVWQALATAGRDEVDREIVRQTRPGIERQRELFYQDICGRIKTPGLVGHARQAMEVVDLNGGRTKRGTVIDVLKRKFDEDAHSKAWEVFQELLDLGFLRSSQNHWIKAGIPALFDYCDRISQEEVN